MSAQTQPEQAHPASTPAPGRAPLSHTLRYLAPNVVTALSMVCAVLAIQAVLRGETIAACWWVLYSTVTDKLDGYVARALKASSPLGVQMDSLADLLNYGFMPAAISYDLFYRYPELGWREGWHPILLAVICGIYALCAALRLARFNVSRSNPDFFFGVPTTVAGAFAMATLITCAKYGNPEWTKGSTYPGWRILGDIRLDWLMHYYPYLFLFLSYLMVSSWRVPKAGRIPNKILNVYVFVGMFVGYALGILHLVPEILVIGGFQYFAVGLYCHFFLTPNEKPEPFFPAD